VVTNLIE
jgi:hypothetical protein